MKNLIHHGTQRTLKQFHNELINLRVVVLLRLAHKCGLYAKREEIWTWVEALGDSVAWENIEKKNQGLLGYIRRLIFRLRPK